MAKEKITYNPENTGPNTVPRNKPAQKRVVAGPRPAAGQISAMTPIKNFYLPVSLYSGENSLPPIIVKGAIPKNPDRNRVTRSVCMLSAKDCPK
jgi:hypothetical protein